MENDTEIDNSTSSLTNNTTIRLPFWTCVFITDNNKDGLYETTHPGVLYKCKPYGEFFVGSSPEAKSVGHSICITFVVLIWLIGLFGVVSNVLNMLIVPKSMKKLSGSLSHLLVSLAVFELITSASAIGFSTYIILMLENVSRGEGTLYMLKITYAIYTFGRVAFIYATILVSIERFIVVTYPTKAETWLSPLHRKLYFIPVIIIALLTDLPLIVDAKVEENTDALESLADFPYLYKYTATGKMLYPWFTYYGQLIIKTWIPVPVLLALNCLLYRSIRRWNKRRESLTRGQKREINVATMLMTIVLLVMLWNAPYYFAFVNEFIIQSDHTYLEVQLLKVLCITSSTTVNFIMYYRNSSGFKKEVYNHLRIPYIQDAGKRGESFSATDNSP